MDGIIPPARPGRLRSAVRKRTPGEAGLDALHASRSLGFRQPHRLMRHAPHRFPRSRVRGQAGNEMPVDMRELIAEQLIIDLDGVERVGQPFGDQVYFFNELESFSRRQMKEFGGMPLKDRDGPAREKLIVVQIDSGQSQVRDEMVRSGPVALARFAGGIAHG